MLPGLHPFPWLLAHLALPALVFGAPTAPAAAGSAVADAPAPAVNLTVAQESDTRWRLRIENAGSVPVRIMADARLLSLEVTAPGAKHAVRCALPADMQPGRPDDRALVVPPQRAYVESFDPRTYCFGAKEEAAIVPGATVIAHLGWAPPARKRKATGPFVVEPLDGVTPIVAPAKEIVSPAWSIAALAAAPGATPTSSNEAMPPTPLPNAPAGSPGAPPSPPDDEGLVVVTTERTDAARKNEVGLTVTVKNTGKHPATLLLRPETLSFEIEAPDGTTERCGGTRSVDSPIRELYDTIAPKGQASVALLLSDVCPGRAFDQPGFYTVRAQLDTRRASGQPIGLRTFDGVVTAAKPTRVRVRLARRPSHAPRPQLE